jgi:hypothetical protein
MIGPLSGLKFRYRDVGSHTDITRRRQLSTPRGATVEGFEIMASLFRDGSVPLLRSSRDHVVARRDGARDSKVSVEAAIGPAGGLPETAWAGQGTTTKKDRYSRTGNRTIGVAHET